MNEVKKTMDEKWQYIYDTVKTINTEMKKVNSEQELLEKHPEIKEFKENNPKSYRLAIEGKFSLIEFKKQKEVYDRAYNSKQEGDHFDRKNGANIAVANQIAKDYNIYQGKEPDFKKAVGVIMEKNEEAKKNIKFIEPKNSEIDSKNDSELDISEIDLKPETKPEINSKESQD